MNKSSIHSIIELLEHIIARPGMYWDYSHCNGLITGIIWMACTGGVIACDTYDQAYVEIASSLGWYTKPNGPGALIGDMDWDDLKKIQERAKVELEIWKHLATLAEQDSESS